jgi:hypothetical protein
MRLLHCLEEIQAAASQGFEEDYLSALQKIMKGGSTKDALHRLLGTRLALSKYYSASIVLFGGGDSTRL